MTAKARRQVKNRLEFAIEIGIFISFCSWFFGGKRHKKRVISRGILLFLFVKVGKGSPNTSAIWADTGQE